MSEIGSLRKTLVDFANQIRCSVLLDLQKLFLFFSYIKVRSLESSMGGIIRSFVAPTTFGKSSGSAYEQTILGPAVNNILNNFLHLCTFKTPT